MSWHSDLSAADRRLVDGLQSGYPVTERPYRAIGELFDESEDSVVSRVRRLLDDGVFRRVGPVLNPPVIGSSALAALAVSEKDFQSVASLVNGYEQVNHNYKREHRWNMWFVVTAATLSERTEILDDIDAATDGDLLRLPMRTEYYIDLEFPVVNDDSIARDSWETPTPVKPTPITDTADDSLSHLERELILEVQDGFPITATPYRNLADTLDVPVSDVLHGIERLRDRNCIKRIGCIVNHHAVGFDENCMVVWDVPDDARDERAVAAGREPSVTYCCHRPRRPAAEWPYNLFTMIHGRSRAAVDETIDDLATKHLRCEHARLHTVEVLKQTGVHYRDLLSAEVVTEHHE
jgi:DNA-binding Lrp family transcriptional regulator